jgi:DNA repair protein RecO (recombination protein O)
VNEHAERDIQNIREMRVDRPYARIPYDPVRGALLLFTQELLYKVLRGEAADPELFGFLEEALEAIDSAEDVRNFPLVLLVQLSGQLGFQPAFPAPGEDRFDLREGEFVQGAVQHGHTMGPVLSGHLAALLPIGFEHMPGPVIPASERRDLLDHLLLYYRMHVEGLGELRSPAVLHQVLG